MSLSPVSFVLGQTCIQLLFLPLRDTLRKLNASENLVILLDCSIALIHDLFKKVLILLVVICFVQKLFKGPCQFSDIPDGSPTDTGITLYSILHLSLQDA